MHTALLPVRYAVHTQCVSHREEGCLYTHAHHIQCILSHREGCLYITGDRYREQLNTHLRVEDFRFGGLVAYPIDGTHAPLPVRCGMHIQCVSHREGGREGGVSSPPSLSDTPYIYTACILHGGVTIHTRPPCKARRHTTRYIHSVYPTGRDREGVYPGGAAELTVTDHCLARLVRGGVVEHRQLHPHTHIPPREMRRVSHREGLSSTCHGKRSLARSLTTTGPMFLGSPTSSPVSHVR